MMTTRGTNGEFRRRARRRGALLLLGALAGCGVLGGGREPRITPEETQRTERIAREVTARLAAEPSLGPGRIRVEVVRGTVSLYGSVQGMGALHCAIRNAQLVPGVQNVADFLVLERGPREVRCLAPRGPRTALSDSVKT